MKDTELKSRRDRDLYGTYVRGLRDNSFSSMAEAADHARLQPAPQFYISARSASLLIGKIQSHQSLIDLNETSRRRIWLLYDRYREYRKDHPNSTLSREIIMEELVDQPAPEYYISPDRAMRVIINERRKARKQMKRR